MFTAFGVLQPGSLLVNGSARIAVRVGEEVGETVLNAAAIVASRPNTVAGGLNIVDAAAPFVTQGVRANSVALATHEMNEIRGLLQAANPNMSSSEIGRYALQYLESGMANPTRVVLQAGDELVKFVPAGTPMSEVNRYGFYMTRAEANALMALSPAEIASRSGLPWSSTVGGNVFGFDVVSMRVLLGKPQRSFNLSLHRPRKVHYIMLVELLRPSCQMAQHSGHLAW